MGKSDVCVMHDFAGKWPKFRQDQGVGWSAAFDRVQVAWGVAVAAIVLSGLAPESTENLSSWIFLASLFLLGMPHGALNALLLTGGICSALPDRRLLVFTYTVLGGVVFWLLKSLPEVTVLLFLLASAIHWGTSDFGRPSGPKWWALGISKGIAVITALFVFHWDDSFLVLQRIAPALPALMSETSVIVLWSFATVTHLLFLWRHGRLRSKSGADFLMAMVLLAVCPPLPGVSVYYAFFHALRYYSWFDHDAGSRALVSSHLLTWGGLGLVGIIAYLLRDEMTWPLSTEKFVDWHLQALIILTIPHLVFAFALQAGMRQVAKPRDL